MIVSSSRMIALLVAATLATAAPAQEPLRYSVSLADTAQHHFDVTLRVNTLGAKNDIFEFAATAPGTYQVMDIGRFVHDFRALDRAGKPLTTERLTANRWRLLKPERVREIRYRIHATRDTTVTEHPVYQMCGSRLVADYAMINGQALFGFPKGMQAARISVRLEDYPSDWTISTALPSKDGAYVAESYDQLVDSPMLLGRLSMASLDVTGVPVQIAVRSMAGKITAPQLRDAMRGMLMSAGAFLGKLPVDRYVFLYDFGETSAGAWEHSYSSEYVLKENDFTPEFGASITDIAAHEFFHVVTPLNIHSEIIEHFNFETPVPSQHLWLYEATTEWAAHKMQLQSGLKSPEAYLASLIQKMRIDRVSFDSTYSLRELALTSFSDSGQRQYGNIYMRGALVSGLLDIRLLELSNGERGLRELIAELTKRYGKRRAFPEDSLFAIIERMTSPAIGEFFARYVRESEHLPIKEYYAKLGITLIEDERGMPVRFEIDPNPTPEQRRLRAAWLGKPSTS
jgi:predicted metalloprotease with PDZ domain